MEFTITRAVTTIYEATIEAETPEEALNLAEDGDFAPAECVDEELIEILDDKGKLVKDLREPREVYAIMRTSGDSADYREELIALAATQETAAKVIREAQDEMVREFGATIVYNAPEEGFQSIKDAQFGAHPTHAMEVVDGKRVITYTAEGYEVEE